MVMNCRLAHADWRQISTYWVRVTDSFGLSTRAVGVAATRSFRPQALRQGKQAWATSRARGNQAFPSMRKHHHAHAVAGLKAGRLVAQTLRFASRSMPSDTRCRTTHHGFGGAAR